MTPEQRTAKLEELKRLRDTKRLLTYRPYPKQLEFHHLGTRERALFKANRAGGTYCAGMEVAMHLTGWYPDWWRGKRFTKAVRCGVGSETGDLLKKGPQRILFGLMEAIGTGTIPRELLVLPPRMSRGTPDGIDTLQVRHCTNGEPDGTLSAAVFMSYADGREKWQSDDWDLAWFDEEPEMDIYMEGLTRTNVSLGPILFTFTPLKGMSNVVMRYWSHHAGTGMVQMSIDEAEHFSAEARKVIIASYQEHELEARTRGIPILGEGKIFKHPESLIKVDPFEIPRHWAQLGAMDFGIDHPFAAVKAAWDRDTDKVYITTCYRERGLTPVGHAAALRNWGVRFAWPHDGLQRDKQSGKQLAQFYREQGLDLISEHAQYPDERGNGLEASIIDIGQRLETGRLKVFSHLEQWFEEYRFFHRKDGLPVKERDDLLCLHGDTLITTGDGRHRMADLVGTIGQVQSIGGAWSAYQSCRMTRKNAPVVRLDFSDGSQVVCTPDHRFLTMHGWVQAVDLRGHRCHTTVSSREYGEPTCESSSLTQKDRNSTGRSIQGSDIISGAGMRSFIAMFGNFIMGRLHRAIIFIISATEIIIKSKIFNAFSGAPIYPRITKAISAVQRPLLLQLLSGVKPRVGSVSCDRWDYEIFKIYEPAIPSVANNVDYDSKPKKQVPIVSVATAAKAHGVEPLNLILNVEHAPYAEGNSALTDTVDLKPAHWHVPESSAATQGVVCLSVRKAGNADVYCMEVPEFSAFAIEDGLIVHNCATRYLVMDLRYAEVVQPLPKSERYRIRPWHKRSWMGA